MIWIWIWIWGPILRLRTPREAHDGFCNACAYRLAMPCEMHTMGPRRPLPSALNLGAVPRPRSARRAERSQLHPEAPPQRLHGWGHLDLVASSAATPSTAPTTTPAHTCGVGEWWGAPLPRQGGEREGSAERLYVALCRPYYRGRGAGSKGLLTPTAVGYT